MKMLKIDEVTSQVKLLLVDTDRPINVGTFATLNDSAFRVRLIGEYESTDEIITKMEECVSETTEFHGNLIDVTNYWNKYSYMTLTNDCRYLKSLTLIRNDTKDNIANDECENHGFVAIFMLFQNPENNKYYILGSFMTDRYHVKKDAELTCSLSGIYLP